MNGQTFLPFVQRTLHPYSPGSDENVSFVRISIPPGTGCVTPAERQAAEPESRQVKKHRQCYWRTDVSDAGFSDRSAQRSDRETTGSRSVPAHRRCDMVQSLSCVPVISAGAHLERRFSPKLPCLGVVAKNKISFRCQPCFTCRPVLQKGGGGKGCPKGRQFAFD